MAEAVRSVRLFVASPGDVAEEREQLAKVVQEINLIVAAIAPERRVVLELVRWETHVAPGLGRDAQDVVNRQIGDYDIFVGIMWKRFGTRTTVAESGTEEEFQSAYTKWEQDKRLPILFYFCQAPFPTPKTSEDIKQLGKVVEFREGLSKKGLVSEYAEHGTFADVIRPHLVLVLSRMLSASGSAHTAAEEAGKLAPSSDVSAAREQISALARQYEEVRNSMPSGGLRTQKMTLIESGMRAIALSTYPLLSELTLSENAGDRLAAVATLKEIPSPEYLTWLASRVGVEKPFIGYHATVALLNAVRHLESPYRERAGKAVRAAQEILGNLGYKDPNQVHVLDEAATELQRGGGRRRSR